MEQLASMALFLLLAVANADQSCYENTDSNMYCKRLELKPDEPLQFNSSFTKLHIHISSGSIGAKTFSLLPNLEKLTISRSAINTIEDGALCSLPKLQEIIINPNKNFPKLTESLLSNCDKIKSLTISHTKMDPSALKNMSGLEYIRFMNQYFDHFTKDYLDSLKSLRKLEFLDSDIEKLDPGVICLTPTLESFRAILNRFTTPLSKSIFESCDKLKQVKFYQNEASWEEKPFSEFTSLSSLSIDTLNIEQLTKEYLTGLDNLEYLEISESSISSINKDAFESLPHLKNLSLSRNRLKGIESGILASLPDLMKLDLARNKLTSIDTISHPTLEELDVAFNEIALIDSKTIKANLPKLRWFRIAGNPASGPESEKSLRTELENVVIMSTYDPFGWGV